METYLLNELEVKKLVKLVNSDLECRTLVKNLQSSLNKETFEIKLETEDKNQIIEYVSSTESGHNGVLAEIFFRHIPELNVQDIEKEELQTNVPLEDFPLDFMLIRTGSRTVNETVKRINERRYVLDPDFQREFVWDNKQQSKLIESCILRIPLPLFYVADRIDGNTVVVDGLQRLTTFQRFVQGEFKLTGLHEKSLLLGKKFDDLSIRYQERILDTNLQMIILDAKAPLRAKMEIFERVNGGTKLTRQQMRNALYCGKATIWLKLATEERSFIEATQSSLNRKSMRDREVVNRFVSFYLIGFEEYPHGDMDSFLANGLEKLGDISENERDNLRTLFCMSMKLNFELFNENAFRKSICRKIKRKSLINISLFDVLSVSFAKLIERLGVQKISDFGKIKNMKQLKNIVVELLNDTEFIDSISKGYKREKSS